MFQKKVLMTFLLISFLIISNFTVGGKSTTLDKNKLEKSTNTIYVDDDGGEDYTKIQDAIDNASIGSTIFVYNGNYTEKLKINKTLILVGENHIKTNIRGEGTFEICANNVNVSNFAIDNSKGMIVNSSSIGNTIFKNIFNLQHSYFSLNLKQSSNNHIHNNSFLGSYGSVFLDNTNNNYIYDNKINGIRYGINLEKSCNNVIYNNRFDGAIQGLNIKSESCRNIVYKNEIYGFPFESNSFCLKISESSNENEIFQNEIRLNIKGIVIESNSKNNKIHNNNFINCLIKATFNKAPLNSWKGNYWGRARILPKIIYGRGGITGLLPLINIDWRPSMEPNDT